jgi:glycosyltransferase involved in cell wall biosynthesis
VNLSDGPTCRPFHLVVYSDAAELGGAEMNLALLLGGLPAEVEVDLVCVNQEVAEWLCDHRPGLLATVLDPIENRTQLGRMWAHRQVFAKLKPDVVHFNLSMASSCQWAVLTALTTRRAKLVVVENSSMGVWSSTSRALKRVTSPRLRAHIAVGEATARALEVQCGIAGGSIETIYHGIGDVRQGLAHDGVGPVICNVGRHDPVKGIDVLLEAMTVIDPAVRLVQIGGGPLHDELISQRDRLGLAGRVEFRSIGWSERVADHLGAFDLFVLPSRIEGLPVSVMEAMLAGLPIVASDVGSVSEEVNHGDNGLLVAPEDPAALAAAINELMADDERRALMGVRSREIAVERFTLAPMIGRYCAMYERVLSGAPRRSAS